MSEWKPPENAKDWLPLYHSAIRYGREEGYRLGYVHGFTDGQNNLTASEHDFAEAVARAMVARLHNGEEINASIKATLAGIEAEKHR